MEDGELLRIGDRFYAQAPAVNGQPVRTTWLDLSIPRTLSLDFVDVMEFPEQGRILSVRGSTQTEDGMFIPVNLGGDLKVRIVSGMIQVAVSNSRYLGAKTALEVSFIRTQQKSTQFATK